MKYQHLSDTVVVKKIKEEGNIGIFHIEGLYTGYGTTLGNALRRVLLSSLPGAAISQAQIKGVGHEFSAIPGVMEDVVELTLNLKQVRFIFLADEPQTLQLRAKGEGVVKASAIQGSTLVRIANPELHIATLTKKSSELDMELVVAKGIGYVSAESRRLERLPVGVIVLDAIYSPVRRVSYTVENMRVGELTNYNRLKLEVETDGTITPSEAVHKASNILKDHFEKILAIEVVSSEALVGTGGTDEGEVKEKKTRKKKT